MQWFKDLINFRKNAKELVESNERAVFFSEQYDKTSKDLDKAHKSEEQLSKELTELESKLENINKAQNERAQVVVAFDDDLLQGTPIIRHKGEPTIEKLVEIKYLSDAHASSEHAVQLGLLVLARDFLDQLVSSYEEDINDD